MNILIVKTSAIGDVTHTLPALAALRRAYPDARIDWLVEEAAADLITGHPDLDRVLVSRRKAWADRLRSGPDRIAALGEFVAFVRLLRKREYDLVIDFQNLLKSGVFVMLARGRRKVGFGRGMEHSECSYIFLNERIPPVSMDQHAVLREMKLLEAIGVSCKDIEYRLPVTKDAAETAGQVLAGHSVGETDSLVAINPVATWETKLWQEEGFSAVADQLLADGNKVVFTGSKADYPVIERIRAAMNNQGNGAVNLAGATSLKVLAAIYARAAVVISTDTGPMHIAAATGTPVVALFGPTAPWRTGPYGDRHRVIRVEMGCSPCMKRQCPIRECMRGIKGNDVIRAVNDLLREKQYPETHRARV